MTKSHYTKNLNSGKALSRKTILGTESYFQITHEDWLEGAIMEQTFWFLLRRMLQKTEDLHTPEQLLLSFFKPLACTEIENKGYL